MGRIYLDHNASSPLRAEARAAMAAALDGGLDGNPSSVHGEGRAARDAVERARAEVARLIGASAEEIVFTSGGTEADNLAIRGGARAGRGRRRVVSSAIEHPAVGESLAALAAEGYEVARVAVGRDGAIAAEAVAALADEGTALVSLAAANHEIGNLYDVAALAAAARGRGALFHSDAVQAAGRVPIDVRAWGVDLLSISAHKLGGPKGVGALYVRRGVEPAPLLVGGHQQRGRRPGTENLIGIMGFGAACAAARRALAGEMAGIGGLRERLEAGLSSIPGARRFGAAARVPGTANLGFAGVEGEVVVMGLDLEGVAVSSGAACTSGAVEASPVVRALGFAKGEAREAVRFSIGAENTAEEIDRVVALVRSIVDRARAIPR
jgi:cysteine desulfurase